MHPLTGAFASTLAGMCTALGALGVFFVRKLPPQVEDALLSSAAGIMLAASFFSLILPGISYAEALGYGRVPAVSMVILGIAVGALLIWLLHHYAPHEHFIRGREGPDTQRISQIWLFVITITLHNLPEGMAVGVGFAGGRIENGLTLAIGIGIQNIPEGLAVAVALVVAGYSRTFSFVVAGLTGLVEGVGGLLGSLATWLAQPLMPVTLGLAAGAMLYVISDEIIPETHRRGYETLATFSLLAGFAIMMFLDATLG